jgi:hypothetical protein
VRRYKLGLIYPHTTDTLIAVTSLNETLFKNYVEEQSKTSSIRLRQVFTVESEDREIDTLVFTHGMQGLLFVGWEEE